MKTGFIIPPYGSMGKLSLLCVCVSFCMHGYEFLSGGKKDRGVKLCTLVRLLSAMRFSHFGELWLAGSHGSGVTSGMSYIEIAVGESELGAAAWWAFGIECGVVA